MVSEKGAEKYFSDHVFNGRDGGVKRRRKRFRRLRD
jgi:hypothetical protein